MTKDVTIFKQPGAISTAANRQGLTTLGQALVGSGRVSRRIQTNTNGTFKRLVNNEQVGKAARGAINVVIVGALPSVSRVFYSKQYDPNATPTMPDCWSNLGDTPDKNANEPQASSCAICPKNVAGSGQNGGRACRFQRRIAVLLENDNSGDVYQFNIPAKSLFGKGNGNLHPFESYVRFLVANHESPDTVVTSIAYDDDADSMELLFSPVRGLSEEEYELVTSAQADPETQRVCVLSGSPAPTGATKQEAKPKVERSDEPEDEEAEAPKAKVRATAQEVLWGGDEEEAEVEQPKKRASAASKRATEAPKADLADTIDEWGSED